MLLNRLFSFLDAGVESIVPRLIGWFTKFANVVGTALITQFPALTMLVTNLNLMVPAFFMLLRLGAKFIPIVGVFVLLADSVRYVYLGLQGLQTGLGFLVDGLQKLSTAEGTPEWIRSILIVSPEVLQKRIAAIQRFQAALSPAISLFKNLNTEIQNVVQALLTGNFTYLQTQIALLGTAMGTVFSFLVDSITQKFQELKKRVGDTLSWVRDNLMALPGMAFAAAIGFGTSIAQGISTGFGSAVGLITKGIPALVSQTFNKLNLPNLLLLSISSFPLTIVASALKAQFINVMLKIMPAVLRLVGISVAESFLGRLRLQLRS